ncbi:hypothetical protein J4E83_009657 [Alternaria metachromatica]|uniref:uncharacterized protein n=1 Tax=Alternaria metachromatica TaxID=283354 RepID=UPI0020C41AE0|nr:uncharacterized protein J4E83_009657 [Alternaria metachromatica]KAI4607201.1 hypothetical protein J4E83_009657 [Alternaria metachromatica]
MTKPSLPSKMWAAQVISFNEPYKVHEISVPSELAPHDLLIKVAVASLCHTDSMVSSGAMGTPLPCTGSHEGAGTVVATGTSVTQFTVGDRVMAGILIGMEEVIKAVRACTGNEGVKATLNVSDAKESAALACAVTKMHGTMIQLAQPDGVVIPFHELILRDIRVRGSAVANLSEARDMLDLVAGHGITVQTSSFQGLGEIEKLVKLAHSGKMKGKGVVIMDQEQIEKEKNVRSAL